MKRKAQVQYCYSVAKERQAKAGRLYLPRLDHQKWSPGLCERLWPEGVANCYLPLVGKRNLVR
jgi:hypothetical protein